MELTPNWTAMRARYNERFRDPGEPEMTQTRLAELLGKNHSEISRYETGDRVPALPTIVEAAAVLRCDPVGPCGDDALYLSSDCDSAVTEASDDAA